MFNCTSSDYPCQICLIGTKRLALRARVSSHRAFGPVLSEYWPDPILASLKYSARELWSLSGQSIGLTVTGPVLKVLRIERNMIFPTLSIYLNLSVMVAWVSLCCYTAAVYEQYKGFLQRALTRCPRAHVTFMAAPYPILIINVRSDHDVTRVITSQLKRRAKKRIKEGKAYGDDSIPPEVLKRCDLDEIVLGFCNGALEGKGIPEQWRVSNIIPVPKKGDLSKPGNYRGIALTSIVAKTLNRMLLHRIRPYVETKLLDSQNGFREGRSTTSHILTLRRILEGARRKQLPVAMAFIDFVKAFDSINRSSLMKILRAYGIPDAIVDLIQWLYTNTKAQANDLPANPGEVFVPIASLQIDEGRGKQPPGRETGFTNQIYIYNIIGKASLSCSVWRRRPVLSALKFENRMGYGAAIQIVLVSLLQLKLKLPLRKLSNSSSCLARCGPAPANLISLPLRTSPLYSSTLISKQYLSPTPLFYILSLSPSLSISLSISPTSIPARCGPAPANLISLPLRTSPLYSSTLISKQYLSPTPLFYILSLSPSLSISLSISPTSIPGVYPNQFSTTTTLYMCV
eukprot:sb/3463427/